MKTLALASLFTVPFFASAESMAQSADAAAMTVTVTDIENGKPIPATFAFCIPDGKGQSKDGSNVSPGVSWSGAPAEAKSYAVLVVDRDVPANFESANKVGKIIPDNFPRQDFYHWVLVDIPANVTQLPEGAYSKNTGSMQPADGTTRVGVPGKNSYAAMGKGPGLGYDGPCPPWNDERLHQYHFEVFALDTPSLGLSSGFTGKQAEDAIKAHTLAKGEVVGTYTQNPALGAK